MTVRASRRSRRRRKDVDIRAAVVDLARELVRKDGAEHIRAVSFIAGNRFRRPVTKKRVIAILSAEPDLQWLDVYKSCFWFGEDDGPVMSCMRKVFSVACRISIFELREALDRELISTSSVPDAATLLAMCAQLPWLKVNGTMVSAKDSFAINAEISDIDLVMVKVLKAAGGALEVRTLQERCVRSGVTGRAVRLRTRHSSLFELFHDGAVCALVGVPDPLYVQLRVPVERTPADPFKPGRQIYPPSAWT